MKKKVLFVTYGGGHAAMIVPVIRSLEKYTDIEIESLALTTGGAYFKRHGLPYKGYKDFITPEDTQALEYGEKLSAIHHNPESGIDEEETIAYLGLSYFELVQQHGEEKAAELWEKNGRGAFLQLKTLERIIRQIKPDMVVATNSPRSEQAAIEVANKLKIPTLSMQDLFGLFNWIQPQADYISVISQVVIDNIRKDKGIREGQKFLITGNPAFDLAFEHRGEINYAWREENLPSLPKNAKALLWLDEDCYLHPKTGALLRMSDEYIVNNLEQLAKATKTNNGYLLVRPHPSQSKVFFRKWIEESGYNNIIFAGDVPLYPLLNACDAVAFYTSTVGSEALLMKCPVIQLDYYLGNKNSLLGQWGVARLAKSPEDLPEMIRQSFYEKIPGKMQLRIDEMFPNEKAAPKIADTIHKILFT